MCLSGLTAFSADAYAKCEDVIYSAGDFDKDDIRLMNIIKKSIEDYNTKFVDISAFHVTFAEFEELYGAMLWLNPSLYYVSAVSVNAKCDENDVVLKFSPVFRYKKDSLSRRKNEIDLKVEEILSGVKDSWSDAEKVLYVHDAIAACAVYYNGSSTSAGRNIYELFVEGKAVCVGYAAGFKYIMDILDIPCICITSETHIWNMVQINSNWYHVDVTWDDTTFESSSSAAHNMLLLSEYAISVSEPPHEQWDFAETADSSKYDDEFWQESYAVIKYYNGGWYYMTTEGLCRYDFSKKKGQLVSKVKNTWKANSRYKWKISFGKVAVYGGKIYFNTANKIYSYDPKTGKTVSVSAPLLPSGYQIVDITLDGNRLAVYSTDDFTDMEKNVSYLALRGDNSTEDEQETQTASPESDEEITVTDNGSTITVSWQENEDAEQYVVYRYNKKTKKAYKIYTTVNTSVTFRKTASDNDCMYAVKVRTAEGLGDFSKWAAA